MKGYEIFFKYSKYLKSGIPITIRFNKDYVHLLPLHEEDCKILKIIINPRNRTISNNVLTWREAIEFLKNHLPNQAVYTLDPNRGYVKDEM